MGKTLNGFNNKKYNKNNNNNEEEQPDNAEAGAIMTPVKTGPRVLAVENGEFLSISALTSKKRKSEEDSLRRTKRAGCDPAPSTSRNDDSMLEPSAHNMGATAGKDNGDAIIVEEEDAASPDKIGKRGDPPLAKKVG